MDVALCHYHSINKWPLLNTLGSSLIVHAELDYIIVVELEWLRSLIWATQSSAVEKCAWRGLQITDKDLSIHEWAQCSLPTNPFRLYLAVLHKYLSVCSAYNLAPKSHLLCWWRLRSFIVFNSNGASNVYNCWAVQRKLHDWKHKCAARIEVWYYTQFMLIFLHLLLFECGIEEREKSAMWCVMKEEKKIARKEGKMRRISRIKKNCAIKLLQKCIKRMFVVWIPSLFVCLSQQYREKNSLIQFATLKSFCYWN